MHQGTSRVKYMEDRCYTKARKVCSNSLAELIAWATEHGFTTKNCKHCDSKRFPFPTVAPQPVRLSEEVTVSGRVTEGAVCQVVINAYERNPIARARCMATMVRPVWCAASTSAPCMGRSARGTSTFITLSRCRRSVRSTTWTPLPICGRFAPTVMPSFTWAVNVAASTRLGSSCNLGRRRTTASTGAAIRSRILPASRRGPVMRVVHKTHPTGGCRMTLSESLPALHGLRAEKLRAIQLLAADVAREEGTRAVPPRGHTRSGRPRCVRGC